MPCCFVFCDPLPRLESRPETRDQRPETRDQRPVFSRFLDASREEQTRRAFWPELTRSHPGPGGGLERRSEPQTLLERLPTDAGTCPCDSSMGKGCHAKTR
ncbi:hypothetical protein EYF80_049195 [Liparis tanakae]|uniref:Uncharacterized protein n=1 Tax=Liparis tanakae TaxID=230148 RepID=A0A4Z2FK23_9TELE|nr:hypothetical protein EYF80_049195 [Liparis tanakae]